MPKDLDPTDPLYRTSHYHNEILKVSAREAGMEPIVNEDGRVIGVSETITIPKTTWLPILQMSHGKVPKGLTSPDPAMVRMSLDWDQKTLEQKAEWLDRHYPLSRLDKKEGS